MLFYNAAPPELQSDRGPRPSTAANRAISIDLRESALQVCRHSGTPQRPLSTLPSQQGCKIASAQYTSPISTAPCKTRIPPLTTRAPHANRNRTSSLLPGPAYMPSLGEHLQTQAKAFRLLLHMLAPIHLELELLHGPLCEVALERALAHIAHEQIELQRRGVPEVPNLEPHRPVHRASRHSVLILTFHLLAFSAAHAPSPRLTWCEVQAHVWNLPYLQWWRNEREASTGLQLGKHMMDAPLDPLRRGVRSRGSRRSW
mmetsp:Transcript_27058/g.71818  ORF Transcript_27058/g.71818 Transcript_27058/m.71818 type:complete len:258 (+) Transcript_27058:116-889(+)